MRRCNRGKGRSWRTETGPERGHVHHWPGSCLKTKLRHRVTLCPTIPPLPTQILHFSLLAPLVHGAGKLWYVFTELLDSLVNWFLLLAHKTLMYYRTFSCLIPEWLEGVEILRGMGGA